MSKVPSNLTTEKGTVLPLTNLKGKAYLMVAYRLQWFNEDVERFTIDTQFLELNEVYTVAKATICILNKEGNLIRKAEGTKRETKADFSDHTEKAETSAIGRALAMLGYGTQFALSDLDEGSRIVDSPVAVSNEQSFRGSNLKTNDYPVGTGQATSQTIINIVPHTSSMDQASSQSSATFGGGMLGAADSTHVHEKRVTFRKPAKSEVAEESSDPKTSGWK